MAFKKSVHFATTLITKLALLGPATGCMVLFAPDASNQPFSTKDCGSPHAVLLNKPAITHEEAFQAMLKNISESHKDSDWEMYQKYCSNTRDLVPIFCISKTLKIFFNDWDVAQVAKKLRHTPEFNLFSKRTFYCKNLYDPISDFC